MGHLLTANLVLTVSSELAFFQNSSYPLLVDVYSEDKQPGVSDLVAINCCSNLESAINERWERLLASRFRSSYESVCFRIYPEHMDLLVSMNSHGDLDVEVVEKNVMIVDGHYAVPTLCQLIDEGGDELKISALTDEVGFFPVKSCHLTGIGRRAIA